MLDTSVFVAGLLNPRGGSGECLRLWYEDALFDVIASQGLFEELIQTLEKPKLRARFVQPQPHRAISAFANATEMHPDELNPTATTRDSNDDFLVSLALSSHADALVSLDEDLLVLRALRHPSSGFIPVIRPGELLTLLRDAGARGNDYTRERSLSESELIQDFIHALSSVAVTARECSRVF